MLGNGVSGVLWSRFNHENLRLSTRKQTAHSAFTLQLRRVDVARVHPRLRPKMRIHESALALS